MQPVGDEPPAVLARWRNKRVWCLWAYQWKRDGEKYDKPPVSRCRKGYRVSITDPRNWCTWDEAVAAAKKYGRGIGLVLEAAGLSGIDLDGCITDSGSYLPVAAAAISFGETYGEVSPSGTGVHLLVDGKVGLTIKRDDLGVEVYDHGRYFTVTADHIADTPNEIRPAPLTIEYLANLDRETPKHGEQKNSERAREASSTSKASPKDFFANVNSTALERLDAWVPVLHHAAKKQRGTGAWRVKSKNLSRNLQEDISYHKDGIQDFGEERGLTAIDAVIKYGAERKAADAAMWLCQRMGVDPTSLGWSQQAKQQDGNRHEEKAAPQEEQQKARLHWAGEAADAETPWLVKWMIPAEGGGLLSGQWGMMKTFMVLDLSASIVTGEPFAGHRIMQTGGVLILAAEGAGSLPRRINGLIKEGKLEPGVHPIVWFDTCPALLADDALTHLKDLAADARDQMKERFGVELRAIVVDTVAAAAGWENENDAAQAQAVMNVLRALGREFHCSAIGVDHFGKNVETGTRGSSAKESGGDFVLAITGERSLSGTVSNTKLTVRKVRDEATGKEIPFAGKIVELGIDRDGDPVTTMVVDWTAPKGQRAKPKWPGRLGILKAAFDAMLVEHGKRIRPFGAEGPEVLAVDREHLRKEFMATVIVKDESRPDAKRQAFYVATKAAVDAKLLAQREVDGGTYFWEPSAPAPLSGWALASTASQDEEVN
jgi:hypothetical protein